MATKNRAKKGIEEDRFLRLVDIVNEGLFPWCKDIATVRSWVMKDKLDRNLLGSRVSGQGRGTKYIFTESKVRAFVEAVRDGYLQG